MQIVSGGLKRRTKLFSAVKNEEGLDEQVTTELDLEHVQTRGKTSRTKQKVGMCMVVQS